MTLAEDIAGDHTHFDGVETVTVTMQGVEDPASCSALQMPLKLGPDSGGTPSTEGRRVIWNVWTTTLTIQPGDRITESGGTIWIVENTQQVTLNTRWRCTCQEAR